MFELNKLYNIDCMEGMKEFPDKFFDLAIVDPPYGIGIGHKVNKTVTIVGGSESFRR
jgi:site-specific DNA-methyltransferase (adenine-specific)